MEEDQEEHLLSSVCQILICKIIYRSCVFLYMTWEERGGFMSRGAYIIEIRRFLILYTVSLVKLHSTSVKSFSNYIL